MAFQIQNYLKDSFNLIDVPEKKSYEGYENFSSNELNHSTLDRLSNQFFQNEDICSMVRCYPYHKTARDEVARHYTVSPNELLLAPGSDFTINLVLMSVQNFQSIILLNPDYYSYERYALINNFKVEKTILNFEKFSESFIDYEKTLNTCEPSIVVISNPNGITGLSLTVSQISIIAQCCYRNKHLLIIDEAYSDFSKTDHMPLLKTFENLLIIKTFSKSHGIAGLRLAAIFGKENLISYLRKTGIENAISGISLNYHIFLLRNNIHIQNVYNDIAFSKHHFINFIAKEFPDWIVFDVAAHFLTIDTHQVNTAQSIVRLLLDKKIVIKYLGSISEYKTCIRITITELCKMKNLIATMKEFKKQYRSMLIK